MPPYRVSSTLRQTGSRSQETAVSASVLYMSMSLDGHIAGPNDEPGNPGGDGFMRLHEWYFTGGGASPPPGAAGGVADPKNPHRAVPVGLPTPAPAGPCKHDSHHRPTS